MRRSYTMLEVIAALGVLALLSACFIGALRNMADMDKAFGSESRAILVLDNALERAAALKRITSADLKSVFEDEYAKSPLSSDSRISKAFSFDGSKARLSVLKAGGKPLAEVELKCRE